MANDLLSTKMYIISSRENNLRFRSSFLPLMFIFKCLKRNYEFLDLRYFLRRRRKNKVGRSKFYNFYFSNEVNNRKLFFKKLLNNKLFCLFLSFGVYF